MRLYASSWRWLVAALVGVGGCGESDSGGNPGYETQPCLDGGCFPDLMCLSNLCVDADGPAATSSPVPPGTSADPPTSTTSSEPPTTGPETTQMPATSDEPDDTTAPATTAPEPGTTTDAATTATTADDTTGGLKLCTSPACQTCIDEECATWQSNCDMYPECVEFRKCVDETCCLGSECVFGACKDLFDPGAINLISNILACTEQNCLEPCYG
ncbi:hypothetical protein [Nannocystis sp. SCPEA4]|uniref:hypothetical protein n=1 Tax=Nannocystis sp. SCPEA4 TaxID=2996787 RepID=UPI00226E1231|nr:hypothetical protein [Nannocystis sp. SCPEA4]MCY1059644.1 hypothetical protein [Nannocystis sp. SCPEA4]